MKTARKSFAEAVRWGWNRFIKA